MYSLQQRVDGMDVHPARAINTTGNSRHPRCVQQQLKTATEVYLAELYHADADVTLCARVKCTNSHRCCINMHSVLLPLVSFYLRPTAGILLPCCCGDTRIRISATSSTLPAACAFGPDRQDYCCTVAVRLTGSAQLAVAWSKHVPGGHTSMSRALPGSHTMYTRQK